PPREAARLLTPSEGIAGIAPLASVFGCDGEVLSLDAARARALGTPPRSRIAVVAGPGDRRLLLAALPKDAQLRDVVASLARELIRTSPHLHWALVAHARDSSSLVLAACTPGRDGSRVAALTVDRGRVMDSDIETVRLLADASNASGSLAHARWLEVLGRDGIGRRFFTALSAVVESLAMDA